MQVYQGLDIVTNKVDAEEQELAKHHMISFLDPRHRFSVIDFRDKSLCIIDDLMKNNLLPIVVGGTNYYIESLVWNSFLLGSRDSPSRLEPIKNSLHGEDADGSKVSTLIDLEARSLKDAPKEHLHNEEDLEDVDKFFGKVIYNDAFENVESEKLWRILERVDPSSAHSYHLKDKRRIIRCLQTIQREQRNYSDILREVNKSEQSDRISLGGPLRYQPTCVFWLNCETSLLEEILDKRVDDMLNKGLLAELEKFHATYNRERITGTNEHDYTKGIFQTIGFKEFHNYLTLNDDLAGTDEANEILRASIEGLKLSTKRFAKRQLRWIRRRFLQSGTRDLPPVFKLTTTTDENDWDQQVRRPAFEIIESIIERRPLSEELARLRQEPEIQPVKNYPGKFYCEPCKRTFIGSHYIEAHLKSRIHDRCVSKKKKQEVASEGT